MKNRSVPFVVLVIGLLAVAILRAGAAYLASDLLGQLDANDQPVFTTSATNNGSSTVNNRGFSFPSGVALDSANHRLFVADQANNRILVFNLDLTNNLIDRVADFVLGQPDFQSSSTATTQNSLNAPFDMLYDGGGSRLFVADLSNNRVLVFTVTSTIVNGQSATNVLGQPDFQSSSTAATQNGMNLPRNLLYDAARNFLFVAEQGNNRVTVFDVATIINGENAINVLGQANFTTSTPTTTQNGMSTPIGLSHDIPGNRLFVTEFGNNRVTVFDIASISDGENAINVLGQPDFTSGTATTTQSGLKAPWGSAYDPFNNRLFIPDVNNRRVMVFDVSSAITNGQNAVAVLGQDNFTSSTATSTQSGFGFPYNSAYDPARHRLYVPDRTNHRVMIYDILTLTTPTLSVGSKGSGDYSQTLGPVNTQGTTTYSIASGSFPPGLILSTTTGAITGTPTTPGAYTFTARASADTGIEVPFIHDKQYTIVIQPPVGGGGNAAYYLPAQTFIPPSNVSLLINGGAASTSLRTVHLSIPATFAQPSQGVPYAMTPTVILSNSGIRPHTYLPPQLHPSGTLAWDLCATYGGYGASLNPCPPGEYTVSAQVYSPWNVASEVVSDSIFYMPPTAGLVSPYVSLLYAPTTSALPAIPATPASLPSEISSALVQGKDFLGITRWLYQGVTGDDVLLLQKFLNQRGYLIGEQNGVFGPLTRAAVIQFQEAYFNQILAPGGFRRGTGIFATSTREFVMRNY